MKRLVFLSRHLFIFGVFFLSATFAQGSGKITSPPIKTFLLLGQSNMVGWGDSAQIDPKMQAEYSKVGDKLFFFEGKNGFASFAPKHYRGGRYGIRGGRIGPEYSFALEVSKRFPHERILIIKHAVGGTTLYAAWSPEWTREKSAAVKEATNPGKHELYKKMLEKVEQAGLLARRNGYAGIQLLGIAWVQGESDARFSISGQSYQKNLADFIQHMRQDLKTGPLPFVFLQVNSMQFPFIHKVRLAQANISKALENVAMIPSSATHPPEDFPKYDRTHYNTEGILRIGTALAEKMVQMIGK